MINPFRDIGLWMRESTGPEPGGPNGLQGEPDHIFRTRVPGFVVRLATAEDVGSILEFIKGLASTSYLPIRWCPRRTCCMIPCS
jgi:hypothetical protein